MKEVVEYLEAHKLVYRSFKEIAPKALGSRKKVGIYLGVDLKSYYHMVILLDKKSRVLRKEAEALMVLHLKLEVLIDAKITKKFIRIRAPLCSKAKQLFETNGWRVWHEEVTD